MAVQKRRKSNSRRGMRRSHNALKAPTLTTDTQSGEVRLRHHVGPQGSYRGRQLQLTRQRKDKPSPATATAAPAAPTAIDAPAQGQSGAVPPADAVKPPVAIDAPAQGQSESSSWARKIVQFVRQLPRKRKDKAKAEDTVQE